MTSSLVGMIRAHDGAFKRLKEQTQSQQECSKSQSQIERTKIFLNYSDNLPSTFRCLGVQFVGLHLGQRVFEIDELSNVLLERPGCQTSELVVSGVANTTRHLILQCDTKHPLLGHNAGCLSGTKEVSRWTKVVEEGLPRALSNCTNIKQIKSALQFLEDILACPFIGHNQRKIRHQAIQLGVLPEQDHTLSHAEWAALPVIRLYIHGLELGATDLLCFGMILGGVVLCEASLSHLQDENMPHLSKWLTRVGEVNNSSILHLTNTVQGIPAGQPTHEDQGEETVTDTNSTVDQKECSSLISQLLPTSPYTELDITELAWPDMDYSLRPQRAGKDNVQKMQQLESMVAGVGECVERLTVTNSVLTIVDFCSGAGHLGIILAHQFPQCKVVIVEAKWGSLRFAQQRIRALNLTNTTLCLTHLKGFIGTFDIGVSLHACGSLTDMIIAKCVTSNAAVVSSPCCYGKIQPSSWLSYPQSEHFSSVVSLDCFIKIAKMADCEYDNEDPMCAVDVDRTRYLEDVGYRHVVLHKLKPLTCSPKNNLIVATR